MVGSHPGQIVCKTLSQKTLHKNRAGGVVQGEGPEFNPSTSGGKKKKMSYKRDKYKEVKTETIRFHYSD
jgi:hypothetical protein